VRHATPARISTRGGPSVRETFVAPFSPAPDGEALRRIHDAPGLAEARRHAIDRKNRSFAKLILDSVNFNTVIKNILRMLGSEKIVETCDQNAYDPICEGRVGPAGTAPPLASRTSPFVSGVGHPLPALSA
jgi:hypothetical protein